MAGDSDQSFVPNSAGNPFDPLKLAAISNRLVFVALHRDGDERQPDGGGERLAPSLIGQGLIGRSQVVTDVRHQAAAREPGGCRRGEYQRRGVCPPTEGQDDVTLVASGPGSEQRSGARQGGADGVFSGPTKPGGGNARECGWTEPGLRGIGGGAWATGGGQMRLCGRSFGGRIGAAGAQADGARDASPRAWQRAACGGWAGLLATGHHSSLTASESDTSPVPDWITTSNVISLICLTLIAGGVVGIVVAVCRRRLGAGRGRIPTESQPGVGTPSARPGRSDREAEEAAMLAHRDELKQLLAEIRRATTEATSRLAELDAAKTELGDQAAAMEEYLADLRARHAAAVGGGAREANSKQMHGRSDAAVPALHLASGAIDELKPRVEAMSEPRTKVGSLAANVPTASVRSVETGLSTTDAKPLTAEVLRLSSQGRTSVQIARELGLQPGVVELMLALRGRK